MTDNSDPKLPPSLPIKLHHLSRGPYIEASRIDRDTFDRILSSYEITTDAQKTDLFRTFLIAEHIYAFEMRRAQQQVPSSSLKKSIEQIRAAAKKLHGHLSKTEQPGPHADALMYYFEMASLKLMSDPNIRTSNPLVQTDPTSGEPVYDHPRIDQIIPLLAYLERVSELALALPEANSPGRKPNSPIRQLIIPFQQFWTEVLGRSTTSYKSAPDAITEFEQFLHDCTKPIAPGRWPEIKSAFSHPDAGDN